MREQNLEHRRVARVAPRVQRLDELLERKLLIRVRLDGRRAYAVEQLDERDSVLYGRAQFDGVMIGHLDGDRLHVQAAVAQLHHEVQRWTLGILQVPHGLQDHALLGLGTRCLQGRT